MEKVRKKSISLTKFFLFASTSLLMLFAITFFSSIRTEAASSKIIPLKSSKVYSSYDITADGKKDNLSIKIKNYGLKVYINGDMYEWLWDEYSDMLPGYDYFTPAFKTSVHLYILNNKNVFIGISATGNYGTNGFHILYKYQSEVLVPVLDVNKLFVGELSGQGYTAKPSKINGNVMTMKCSTGITSGGIYEYNTRYKLSGSKLKPIDSKYKITKTIVSSGVKKLTVLKPFKIYKQPGSKKVAFTTKPGEKLKPIQICPKGKKAYILVEGNNKRRGWTNMRFKYGTISSY